MNFLNGILAAVAAALICSCNATVNGASEGNTGVVGVRVNLERAGSALGKAAGDTTVNLDSLKIILTSPGQVTQEFAYAISGNAAAGNVSVTVKYFTVAALKVWKARIISLDTTLNPTRTDTVHMDSVTFTVLPADTTIISPTLNARYAVLKERILANFPDSLSSGIRYLRLRVNGLTEDSLVLGTGINAVHFATATAGWAVGNFGVILSTTNGGTTWARHTSGTTRHLKSVFMASSTVGWAVGDSGTILKTINGSTWTSQTSGTTLGLNAVRGLSANTSIAWVVGNAGKILLTNNGGTAWRDKVSGTANNLNAVFTTAVNVAWTVGDGGIVLKTMDSTNWVAKASGTGQNLYAVHFAPSSSTQGWIAGAGGTLRKTLDSSSWTARTSNTTQDLRALFVPSATSTGYVVGSGGTILKTTDSSTWNAQTSNTTQNLTSVFATGLDSAFAAGADAPFTSINNATVSNTWSTASPGSRGFDKVLAFKRLAPGLTHTILLQAIDTTAGPLRGYEITSEINVTAGQDITLTVNLLEKCGYLGTPVCTP
jgi:hypothetical protein